MKRGWGIERALSEPIHKMPEKSLREKCKEKGLNFGTILNRIYSLGWSEEKALNTPIRRIRRHTERGHKT